MSRNIGSHVFRQVVNGSVVHVDIGLCEDIDYNFFGSGDSTVTEGPNDDKNNTIIAGKEKDEKSLKLNPFCDSKNSKNENICTVKVTDVKNESHSSVQLDSADNLRVKRNLKEETLSSKEDDCMNLRGLMNCIAYGESKNNDGDEEEDDDDDDDDDHVVSKVHSRSSDFLSLSTDTTSEITDVTTRSSSSGCSSMPKHEPEEHLPDKHHKDDERKQQKHDKPADVSLGTSMKLLVNALDSFDKQKRKSLTSNISIGQRNRLGRKNMSFSNEEYWKIERENEILLRKLQVLRRPRPKQPSPTISQPKLPSSAVNRRKEQTRIDHDNMILLKKIEQVKPSAHIAVRSLWR